MKRLIAPIVGLAFVAGITGSALAQSQATPPAATPPAKEEKKAPAESKKPAGHNANGTVKTAAPDTLVVTGKGKGGKETEWTFTVDAKTKVRKGGKDIAARDLAAGDPVHVRYHEEGGKNVADSVMVRTAKKAADASKAEAPKKDETKK